MSLPRALEKLRDHARQPLPPHKLTIGIFSKLWLGEKSASLIVGALYSSVKKILRCRCRVANRRFPGFFPLPLCAVAQAGRLEKSHNRRTCCATGRPPLPGSGGRQQPVPAGCAILDPTAVQHGRAASLDRGRLRNRLVASRRPDGSNTLGLQRTGSPAGRPGFDRIAGLS